MSAEEFQALQVHREEETVAPAEVDAQSPSMPKLPAKFKLLRTPENDERAVIVETKLDSLVDRPSLATSWGALKARDRTAQAALLEALPPLGLGDLALAYR